VRCQNVKTGSNLSGAASGGPNLNLSVPYYTQAKRKGGPIRDIHSPNAVLAPRIC
jgi:hypothetical protein